VITGEARAITAATIPIHFNHESIELLFAVFAIKVFT